MIINTLKSIFLISALISCAILINSDPNPSIKPKTKRSNFLVKKHTDNTNTSKCLEEVSKKLEQDISNVENKIGRPVENPYFYKDFNSQNKTNKRKKNSLLCCCRSESSD